MLQLVWPWTSCSHRRSQVKRAGYAQGSGDVALRVFGKVQGLGFSTWVGKFRIIVLGRFRVEGWGRGSWMQGSRMGAF